MKLKIEIRLDNAAFEEPNGPEAARILRDLAMDLAEGHHEPGTIRNLRDVNGNVVGYAKVTR
jgi:hypothetical protein